MRHLLPLAALLALFVAPSAMAGDTYRCTVTGAGATTSVSTCVSEDDATSYSVLGSGFWLVQCTGGSAKVRGDAVPGMSAVNVGVKVQDGQLYAVGRFVSRWYLSVSAAAGVKCQVFSGEAQ